MNEQDVLLVTITYETLEELLKRAFFGEDPQEIIATLVSEDDADPE